MVYNLKHPWEEIVSVYLVERWQAYSKCGQMSKSMNQADIFRVGAVATMEFQSCT